mgnify:CR=1 FL=1
MIIKNQVFNSNISSPFNIGNENYTIIQRKNLIAELFEQLLIFDVVIISTNRLNNSLKFLIEELGINTVENLIEREYIKFILWTPVILSTSGSISNGKIDESTILGKPPILVGSLSDEDKDLDYITKKVLDSFDDLHRDRKRSFTRKAIKNYIIPDGMGFSNDTYEIISSSYENNIFENLGLPNNKDFLQLNLQERNILFDLSHKLLETLILFEYDLKSINKYDSIKIINQNVEKIGKAFNIIENCNTIFKAECVPNLKQLYIQERINFNDVFHIRNLSSAKFYRKWINKVSENVDSTEITKEYLNEIKGNSKFFNTSAGRLIKFLTINLIGGLITSIPSNLISTISGFGLNAIDSYILDSALKGSNPSMFIEYFEKELNLNHNKI